MDLRSIINSDTSGSTKGRRDQPLPAPPRGQVRHDSSRGDLVSPSTSFQESNQTRPAPPPLQPLAQSDIRSPSGQSSLNSAQSPYQQTPSSASFSGGQYPFPPYAYAQSPGHGPPLNSHREGFSSAPSSSHQGHFSYPQQGSPGQQPPSATTPGGTHHYGQYLPSHSSQSTPTPTSAHSQSAFQYRGSPASATSQTHLQSQPYPSHHSQPGTPLGPPATFSRSSTGAPREQPSPYSHTRRPSSGAYGPPSQAQGPLSTPPIKTVHSPPNNEALRTPEGVRGRPQKDYIAHRERERSISISPKTKVTSVPLEAVGNREMPAQVTPAKRKYVDHQSPNSIAEGEYFQRDVSNGRDLKKSSSPPGIHSNYVNGGIQGPVTGGQPPVPTNGSNRSHSETRPVQQEPQRPQSNINTSELSQARAPSISDRSDSRGGPSSAVSPEAPSQTNSSSVPTYQSFQPVSLSKPLPSASAAPSEASPLSAQRPKKRTRYAEPPIFAQKASRSTSGSPRPANRRPTGTNAASPIKQENLGAKVPAPLHSELSNSENDSNGVSAIQPDHPIAIPQPQPAFADNGPLGRWEPSITNLTPYEEITRVIADFLFLQVVERGDVGAGAAGSVPGAGGQLEIEAKLGQLIDKTTNDRLRLPIMTEAIVNNADPGMRTMFKSSMTETQHRSLNQFLNQTVVSSQPPKQPQPPSEGDPPKQRVPVSYVHTRERDRFFDLPPQALATIPLPPSVRPHVNTRHKMRLRVTTDEKTGAPLAKIVKVRLADLDVYSPRTPFDWRLSVNLELTYAGDMDGLTEVLEGGKKSDRRKDRMTYRHQAYQIDLTQVTTPSEDPSKPTKEHELEVELSADAIREQGLLAKRGQATQYEDLVKGFVDNVRTLARV
ncbi:MAG: mRNA-capping enzyme subunit beta [Chaenotheca gracillima]|nr:MAG: mRNA-capping enzyme subunit beta [Chaenotheca gracillima]